MSVLGCDISACDLTDYSLKGRANNNIQSWHVKRERGVGGFCKLFRETIWLLLGISGMYFLSLDGAFPCVCLYVLVL